MRCEDRAPSPGLCRGALPWLGGAEGPPWVCEGSGSFFLGESRCFVPMEMWGEQGPRVAPKSRWIPGLGGWATRRARSVAAPGALREGFRGGQRPESEGCVVAGEFNVGTGGGGGGPGGKSFPKCARRAWEGCHRLVYFVLLGKRWGKCFCIRAWDVFSEEQCV